MARPVCFVLMPFGRKVSPVGSPIDFDAVYSEIIRPAVEEAELEPIRADEEQAGGIIHKPMFERLLLCPFAVADLTTANANVFYELGIRHAAKDRSTVLVFAEGVERLPFDVALLRGLPYRLSGEGRPADPGADREALTRRLVEARQPNVDSPLYQLVEDYPAIAHERTDVFRQQVDYAADMKRKLATARSQGLGALREIEASLARLEDVDPGILVDLLLSYRGVKGGWGDVVRLAERMPRPLCDTVLVREQRAMALNREGRSDEAVEILEDLVRTRGPSSETFGLLGRVYKDRWEQAGTGPLASGYLRKAIDAYRAGFEADWRDAYPGVNAVTLMELAQPPMREEQAKILPVVRYAVERKVAHGRPDYWDHATLLELAVLTADREAAEDALAAALPEITDAFMPETTARNLRLIRQAHTRRGAAPDWLKPLEDELMDAHRDGR